MALPEGRQVLLGQIPLEKMDWWVDLNNRRLVGNPDHGGQWMAEVFRGEITSDAVSAAKVPLHVSISPGAQLLA